MLHYRRALRILFMLSIMCVLALPQVTAAHDATDHHKEAVGTFFTEVLNAGNQEIMTELFAPDYVLHGYGEDMDAATYRTLITNLRAALPDFQATLEVLIAEGEWAASRAVLTGTFEQEWLLNGQTIIPNQEAITWSLNTFYRFDDQGLIVEEFASFDQLNLLVQLDAAPLPKFIAELVQVREHVPAVMSDPVFEVSDETKDSQRAAFTLVIEDALNHGDLTAIETSMAEDYLTHEPFGDFTREQFTDVVAGFRSVVPDLKVTIDTLLVEGDWLAAHLTYEGIFSEPISNGFVTIEPTNEPIKFLITVFVHYTTPDLGIEDFKEYNRLGWLRQLGILPPA